MGERRYRQLGRGAGGERVGTAAVGRGVSLAWPGSAQAHVSAIGDLALRHGWSRQDAQRDSAQAVETVSALVGADAVDAEYPGQIIADVLEGESGPWLR